MRTSDSTVRPSVLDRLIDLEPREGADMEVSRAESEARHRRAVLRDLEWLLNTRRTTLPADRSQTELRSSVHHYGIPDVTSLSADSKDAQGYLLSRVEESIRLFEPRLTDIRVDLAEGDDGEGGSRAVRLRVEATLLMDPDPERIVFDTVLETVSGSFQVEE
jgi:type VI secretion system protein ImpF